MLRADHVLRHAALAGRVAGEAFLERGVEEHGVHQTPVVAGTLHEERARGRGGVRAVGDGGQPAFQARVEDDLLHRDDLRVGALVALVAGEQAAVGVEADPGGLREMGRGSRFACGGRPDEDDEAAGREAREQARADLRCLACGALLVLAGELLVDPALYGKAEAFGGRVRVGHLRPLALLFQGGGEGCGAVRVGLGQGGEGAVQVPRGSAPGGVRPHRLRVGGGRDAHGQADVRVERELVQRADVIGGQLCVGHVFSSREAAEGPPHCPGPGGGPRQHGGPSAVRAGKVGGGVLDTRRRGGGVGGAVGDGCEGPAEPVSLRDGGLHELGEARVQVVVAGADENAFEAGEVEEESVSDVEDGGLEGQRGRVLRDGERRVVGELCVRGLGLFGERAVDRAGGGVGAVPAEPGGERVEAMTSEGHEGSGVRGGVGLRDGRALGLRPSRTGQRPARRRASARMLCASGWALTALDSASHHRRA
ncbi:hypothetical protein STTU_p0132 (plasmid) [Streptomyces sp. Tu6071]|nr:hypothetical protein STTU_p0132 [Streptomyces sp. Tu6071]